MIIIPAYQAQQVIGSLVKEVRAQGLPVLVVDDASTDETALEAEKAGASVIRRRLNGGKGAALRDGIAQALREGSDWVLTMDADGQHLPSEIPVFLRRAERTNADLLVGDRMQRPRGMPLDRWLTNFILSKIVSRMAGQQVPDTQCGYRMIRRRLLESVRLTTDRFEIESELVIRAGWAGFRIESVPVSSVYRRQMSFIRPLSDTVRFFKFLGSLKKERN